MVSHRNNVTVALFVEPGDGELQDEVNTFLYSLVKFYLTSACSHLGDAPDFLVRILEHSNLEGLLCNACVQCKTQTA